MTEVYLPFLCAHYRLYGNAPLWPTNRAALVPTSTVSVAWGCAQISLGCPRARAVGAEPQARDDQQQGHIPDPQERAGGDNKGLKVQAVAAGSLTSYFGCRRSSISCSALSTALLSPDTVITSPVRCFGGGAAPPSSPWLGLAVGGSFTRSTSTRAPLCSWMARMVAPVNP